MSFRRIAVLSLSFLFCLPLVLPHTALGQDDPSTRRGRKYKAPPAMSHIEVVVTKKFNGKPVVNAGVVFNPSKDGKDLGSLEVKTDPEGKAIIDIIPVGSLVRVQIIADGLATFASDYAITEPTRTIEAKMLRPQEQISTYTDNEGKSSERKAGVQEPSKSAPPPANSGTTAPKQ
jgi:hypothetical protein